MMSCMNQLRNANELNLDDSFVRELFASDSESEFEGF